MDLALIIVGGLVVMTAIAAMADYFGKRQGKIGGETGKRLEALEKEVSLLGSSAATKDERIEKLETELRFLNKLIVDKTR
jgi:hypothetical protein